MASDSESANNPAHNSDSTDNAASTGQNHKPAPVPPEPPIKQHNPGDQGINPGQRGPAQPSGHDVPAKGSGT